MRTGMILLLACLGGCNLDAEVDPDGGANPGNQPPVAQTPTGLPCDIAQILQAHCLACHGAPPAGGAPMSLLGYADLAAPSSLDPSKSRAEVALERFTNASSPMPPAGTQAPLSSAEIASWQSWVSAGLPMGSCGGAGSDGGTNYATPPTCTSGSYYMPPPTGDGSPFMDPGQACISCHAKNGAGTIDGPPLYSIAGTAYPTAHEYDNCNGANAGGLAQVVITDANNQTFTLTVNSAGNFTLTTAVAVPFHAKVVVGASERAMASAQTVGDCNSCHTESGASGAPGRIMLP
jgi:mono/diheme cytochrome c family protein